MYPIECRIPEHRRKEVKRALGSIANNMTSGGDRIPTELLKSKR